MNAANISQQKAPRDPGITILRFALAAMMLIHGVTRIAIAGVVPFGGFLASKGFPFGVGLAWAITIFELAGSALLFARRHLVPVALWFALELLLGIVLVHSPEGWFVVGAGRNGMEYSVLLIAGFIALVVSEQYHKRNHPKR